MKYLTLAQALKLHAAVLVTSGGTDGIRDLGRLESAVRTQEQAVFGSELYPGIIDKAAALIRGIINDHPFVDGNKRTGMLAGLSLLRINDGELVIKEGEIEDFAVLIATNHLGVKEIAEWLHAHSS